MNGEYLLSLDPYNFNTEEEYVKFYDPKAWDKEKESVKEILYEKKLQDIKL